VISKKILRQQYIKLIGMQQNKVGILLSGGMDSIALAYWKKPEIAITIDYGQRAAKAEIEAASQVAKELNIVHYIISVDCSKLGCGDMSGTSALSISPTTEWWPYRNQLLVTLACMKGLQIGMTKLLVGSVKTDGSHTDGTFEFYEGISDLMKFQEGSIEIDAPAINLTTVELIKTSHVPYSLLLWAHSCHTSNHPCMRCNGCMKYLYVKQQLNLD
jgi:7-cyano-7-deazaguanine synthase